MKIKIYQVDAFASQVFQGNPAAVCPLDTWLDDEILQKIAEENNLSETAFIVSSSQGWQLRWFTPLAEVDLCGHATLATAHVLYTHLGFAEPKVIFHTKSGELVVKKTGDTYSMDFPITKPIEVDAPSDLLDGLCGIKPKKVLAAFDYIIVLDSEEAVKNLKPDFSQWMHLDLRGVVVTAQGSDVDFVSRCFFPKLRVNEDPVTGSAHCELLPYWHEIFKRNALTAKQISSRSGMIMCELKDERAILTGSAVDYMSGVINV